jgi:putative ABC transport system permease protein
MFSHYFAVTLGVFAQHRLHTSLTIGILTLGFSCFLSTLVFVLYLDSFDRQFKNSERIYVIYQSSVWPTANVSHKLSQRTAIPVAEQLKIEVPELAAVARYLQTGMVTTVRGSRPTTRSVAFADPDWQRVFDLDLVAGDLGNALNRPRSAIITTEAATQMFGTESAIGKVLLLSDQGITNEVTISAVVAAIPPPSHVANTRFSTGFEILASWDALDPFFPYLNRSHWTIQMPTTYVLLPEDGSFTAAALNARLSAFGKDPLPEGSTVSFEARHISSLARDALQDRIVGVQAGALPLELTTLLLVLAGVILGIACLNFINLTTARSATRGTEIGVRKALGATFRDVICQELIQTGIAVTVSCVIAIAALGIFSRVLGDRWGVILSVPWDAFEFWWPLAGVLIAVTTLSGLYPAVMLARVNPVKALRVGTLKAGSRTLRALLVSAQFASAAFLGIAVTVLYLQAATARHAAIGRFSDQYIVLPQVLAAAANFDTVATELMRGRGIKGVAGIVNYPWQDFRNAVRVSRSADDEGPTISMAQSYVSGEYFRVMEVPLLAGRGFSQNRADEESGSRQGGQSTRALAVVLDRRASNALGWPNPADAVGEHAYVGDGRSLEVIGVVESLPLALRNGGNDGVGYLPIPNIPPTVLVRIASDEASAALDAVSDTMKRLAPTIPVRYQFLDEAFEQAYWAFDAATRLIVVFALLATLVAAVGLFGMASFMTARRTREIGLRKTQGATSNEITRLLLLDFSMPVVLANIVVWPFAYIAAREYLNLFVERINLTPLPFLLTLGATLLIAWLVVGIQVMGAATLNPAIALRHE